MKPHKAEKMNHVKISNRSRHQSARWTRTDFDISLSDELVQISTSVCPMNSYRSRHHSVRWTRRSRHQSVRWTRTYLDISLSDELVQISTLLETHFATQASWYCTFTFKCTQSPKINNFTVSISTKFCTTHSMGIPLHSHFGLNTGYNICYPWYIEIGNIYRTLKIQNPGNIGAICGKHGSVCINICFNKTPSK